MLFTPHNFARPLTLLLLRNWENTRMVAYNDTMIIKNLRKICEKLRC